MKRGHLQHRPSRGRTVAWARVPRPRSDGVECVQYRLFTRLSTTGASLAEIRDFDLATLSCEPVPARDAIARELAAMRAQLRWRRDQLDFQHLGMTDPTPAPTVAA